MLEEKLKTLPKNPGVYLMKNSAGKIIYVGKAKILKNRVRQYFQQENQELIDVAVDKVAEIMQRDDDLTEVSNFGNESPFSSASFQEMNATPAQQQAAKAYASFA